MPLAVKVTSVVAFNEKARGTITSPEAKGRELMLSWVPSGVTEYSCGVSEYPNILYASACLSKFAVTSSAKRTAISSLIPFT